MPKKEPLYPHIPKRRKKGTNAWRCKQCDWTAWNVIRCPKCGSKDLEELSIEEVLASEETGKPVIHPQEPYKETTSEQEEASEMRERAEGLKLLYCKECDKEYATWRGLEGHFISTGHKGIGSLLVSEELLAKMHPEYVAPEKLDKEEISVQ